MLSNGGPTMKLVHFALVALLAASAVACGVATPAAQAPTGNEVGTATITSALTPVDGSSDEAPRVGKAYRSKRATEDLLEPKHVSREGKKTLGFGTK